MEHSKLSYCSFLQNIKRTEIEAVKNITKKTKNSSSMLHQCCVIEYSKKHLW